MLYRVFFTGPALKVLSMELVPPNREKMTGSAIKTREKLMSLAPQNEETLFKISTSSFLQIAKKKLKPHPASTSHFFIGWNQFHTKNFQGGTSKKNTLYQTKLTQPNLTKQTKLSQPSLLNQTYHSKPTKQNLTNLPNQTYQTKLNKPNLTNQTYQTQPTQPDQPNQTYQRDLPTKPSLLNQTYQTKPTQNYWLKQSTAGSVVPLAMFHI